MTQIKNLLNRYKNMPDNLKATIVFAIASFATSGINYITTPIFTRILTVTQYGTVSLYNTWYSIIQVFASVSLIYPGILNVGLYDHRDNRWKYLSSMLGITSAATALLFVLYFIFYNQVNTLIGLPASLIVLMLLTCLIQPATTFWTFKQRYEYDYKITFFVSVGSAIVAQIVSIITVWLMRNSGANLAVVRLWSAAAVNLTVALVLFVYILTKGKSFTDFPVWKATILVAVPLIPHYLSTVVLNGTDKIMIEHMVGEDKVGIYSLAAILSAVGILIWRALSVTYTPFVNARLATREFKLIRTLVKPLLTVVGAFCICTALAGPEIIKVLATDEYMEGVYVIPPIAAGIFTHALYDNFTAVSFFHKKSVLIMLATVTAAVCNVVLNYYCIKQFGYIAAGYTTLVSNLILTTMHYLNMRIVEKEQVFDGKFSIIATAVVTVSCLICNALYSIPNFAAFSWIIRWALIVAVLVLVFKYRKRFLDALTAMKI